MALFHLVALGVPHHPHATSFSAAGLISAAAPGNGVIALATSTADQHPEPSCRVSSQTQKMPPNLRKAPDPHAQKLPPPHTFPVSPTCAFSGQRLGIAFIHVGKAGGSTIGKALKDLNFNFSAHHVFDPYASIDCRHDIYIVSTRDPVNRTISAFNWRHTIGGRGDDTACHTIGGGGDHTLCGPSPTELELYNDCFPELPGGVSHFAEALGEQTRCGWLARKCIMEPGAHLCHHLGKGHYWYLIASGLLPILQRSDKRVAVITQEALDDELADVLDWLCVPRDAQPAIANEKSVYDRSSDTALSPKGRAQLERFLASEYYAIENVLALSEAGANATNSYAVANHSLVYPADFASNSSEACALTCA